MSKQTEIKDQMILAMKAKDANKVNVLRGLMSAFTNELISKKRLPTEELSDEDALTVIARAVKQRKDSIEQFEKGGRQDLADAEKEELAILERYLPAQMSHDEVHKFVSDKLASIGTDANKGKVMGEIMRELKGRADGAVVKEVVDSLLV